MTRDEIIDKDLVLKMARQAGCGHEAIDLHWVYPENLEAFASLVAQHAQAEEREACAKVCEDFRDDWFKGLGRYEFMGEGADYCADAIRARGQVS